MPHGFAPERLSESLVADLTERRRKAAADIVRLTSIAGSGHPGGSLSTLDALMLLYATIRQSPEQPHADDRDRVIVSHGHITPGVYSTLASFGFFDIRDAYIGFRRAGSAFGGHVENVVPGIEWNTGNLGQGLSAGCGFALAARLHGRDTKTFVLMGDGEQQKGQIGEGRRFAAKFELDNLVALVDVNGLQIGGKTDDIMPLNLEASWAADGWEVIVVDGHDFQAMYGALRRALQANGKPSVLLLNTVMGKGIPEIEDDHGYHGKALNDEMVARAFAHLGVENDLDALRELRSTTKCEFPHTLVVNDEIRVEVGEPRTYEPGVVTDCRSAYGAALEELAQHNNVGEHGNWPVVGISCDLEGSVKMNGFHAVSPKHFIETGISEHHAAVLTGALSKEGIVPFYSTFGMFAVVEGYNQQRLNDQNHAAPKIVTTHCGLDVGEDGPTHQCIDYVALMRNLFGFECFVPADPNEADRIVRYVAGNYAPTVVAMGRSKLPVITDANGNAALTGDFVPGKWQTVRPGDDAVVFAFGPMVYRAVEASAELAKEGFGLRVVNASSLKPHDEACIVDAARSVGRLLTYEDHNANTGLGSIVAGVVADNGLAVKLRRLGVTQYGTSGKPDDLFAEQGLAPSDLMEAARSI